MSKTIVNIITDESPIPAYLFVKEMYEPGDRLMFVSAKSDEEDLDHLASLFAVSKELIDEIIFMRDSDEFMYERICRRLNAELKKDTLYYVNLAGGTRYLAIAVQQAFEKFNAKFFYVNVEGNTIVSSIYDDSIYDDDDYTYPIKHRMSVAEYLTVHDMLHDIDSEHNHSPYCSLRDASNFFKAFSSQTMPAYCYDVLEKLRHGYRSAKVANGNRTLHTIKRKYEISISEIQHPHNPDWVEIPEMTNFLNFLDFATNKQQNINKDEIDFITGGWLEEYVYYWVQKHVQPDDVHMGVHIQKKNVPYHDNELDVIFTKNNHLYVIECKTGVESNRMFNEIVYKVCALKEALLGLSCHSFIVSLKKDNLQDGLKKVAGNMDVTFIDHAMLTRPAKLTEFINKLAK